MKVLRLNAYFYPEITAANHLMSDLLEAFEKEKIECTIYTPVPTRGVSAEVRKAYKKKHMERINGGYVIVNRFSVFRERKNPVLRALRYFICSCIEYNRAKKETGVDVVFGSSTPPTQGMLSALLAKKLSGIYKRKVPFVYDLQDIFPDSLVNAKMTHKGSILWKIGRKIENYTYQNADKIIVISEGFKNNIMKKGVPEGKIKVISNWIDLESVNPVDRKNNTLISEFGIDPRKYIIVYAGNFGAAQGADIILKAARNLKQYKDVQFVIFGGGAYFEEAKRQAATMENVFIHKLLPQDRISEVYSLGDIALITCKKGTGNAGMPSKMWSIMACNTPVLASFDSDSDLAVVIKNAGAGRCIEPENEKALTEAILEEYQNRKENNSLNLRSYVEQTASKDMCLQNYIKVIKASL